MATSKGSDKTWVKTLSDLSDEKQPSGEGWKTVAELKEITGHGPNLLYTKLGMGLKNGTIEKFSGSAMSDCGKMVRRVWYRIK